MIGCTHPLSVMSGSNLYKIDDTDPHASREPTGAWLAESVPNTYNTTITYTITKDATFRIIVNGEPHLWLA